MALDQDIYYTAQRVIEEHSRDAITHATMQADKLLALGDVEGAAMWCQIIMAIDDLRSPVRPPGVWIH
jgi:hypothetical protein